MAKIFRMVFTRFDVILVFILVFSVALIAADLWLKVNGFTEFSSPVFDYAKTISGGEIAGFTVFQVAKEIVRPKSETGEVEEVSPKSFIKKHPLIADLEEGSK